MTRRVDARRVEVWRVDLDAGEAAAMALLSAAERARADRFAAPLHRARFIAARAALRRILAGALDADPAALAFIVGAWGKPALAPPFAATGLSFNLSHCDGLMLCAVTRDRRVGIDVERERADVDHAALARRYFSAREIAALERLPEPARRRAFTACWTRKEAYVKATGRGLSTPLDAFSVSLAPGEAAALLERDDRVDDAAAWTMAAFAPAREHAAALVVEGGGWALERRRWTVAGAARG